MLGHNDHYLCIIAMVEKYKLIFTLHVYMDYNNEQCMNLCILL